MGVMMITRLQMQDSCRTLESAVILASLAQTATPPITSPESSPPGKSPSAVIMEVHHSSPEPSQAAPSSKATNTIPTGIMLPNTSLWSWSLPPPVCSYPFMMMSASPQFFLAPALPTLSLGTQQQRRAPIGQDSGTLTHPAVFQATSKYASLPGINGAAKPLEAQRDRRVSDSLGEIPSAKRQASITAGDNSSKYLLADFLQLVCLLVILPLP